MNQDGEGTPVARAAETLVLHREDLVVDSRVVQGDTIRIETVTRIRE